MSAPTVDRFELRHGRGATRHWAGLDASAVGARELADELSGRTLFALSSAPILALHGAVLERFAAECRAFHRIEIPDGEAGKSLEVAGAVWRRLLELGGKRDSLLIAFGGGSVGDLAGFAAGAFLRGVGFVQVPTTLLAQVDASIGGKTAIDLPEAKNSVGLFHQPLAVIADTALLATLPAEELRSGLVEAIKTGVLLDPALLDRIERDLPRLLAGEAGALGPVVAAAARAKASLVERDPEEAGERELLNLGHTLGHAIEAAAGYGSIRHGDAVAHGIRFALRLARSRGLEPAFGDRMARLLDALATPSLPRLASDDLILRMARDKKARESGLGFVLPLAAGRAERGVRIPSEEVARELAAMLGGSSAE